VTHDVVRWLGIASLALAAVGCSQSPGDGGEQAPTAVTAPTVGVAPSAEVGAGGPAAPAAGGTLSVNGLDFPSTYATDGIVTLKDGMAEEPVLGSDNPMLVRLSQQGAMADFDGDGSLDMAVVLTSDPGGSGTFYDLYVILNQNGQRQALPPVFLGDRIVVESVISVDSLIAVQYLDRAPGEPMTAPPTVSETRYFKVIDDALVEVTVTGEVIATPATDASPSAPSATP